VGFDDSKDLGLEGAKSALPIWTEFMKRAHQHRAYRNVSDWDAPDGVVSVDIDPTTGQLATAGCPAAKAEYFVSGTQPVELCRLHGGGATQVAGWETAPAPTVNVKANAQPNAPPTAPGVRTARAGTPVSPDASVEVTPPQTPPAPKKEDKKGFFGKIRDIFR